VLRGGRDGWGRRQSLERHGIARVDCGNGGCNRSGRAGRWELFRHVLTGDLRRMLKVGVKRRPNRLCMVVLASSVRLVLVLVLVNHEKRGLEPRSLVCAISD
ncbi:unnamed protein product, partial [Ascophyllum nodosum]